MNKEILLLVEALSNEKGVNKDVIFEAVEIALATAAKKRHAEEIEARVAIDQNTGDYETFRVWQVFADDEMDLIENPAAELTLTEALKIDPNAKVGATIEQQMESIEFGRIAVQTI